MHISEKKKKRFKVFVANQAQKIQVDSDVNQWNYVNDDASKKTWSKKGDFKQ